MKAGKFQITAVALAVGAVFTQSAWADSVQDQINDLDQKIRILQRQQEIKNDDAATKAKDSKTVTAGYDSKGFVLKTGDGQNEFRVNGFVQEDSRWYIDPPQGTPVTNDVNTFTTRRLRLVFSGTVGKYYSYYLQPSWDGGTAGLQDAYVNAGFAPSFNLRFGKFKLPFGLERLQSSSNNSLVEAGFTTYLTPNYETGVQALGTLNAGSNALDYQVALVNGASQENGSSDIDGNDNKEWAVRLFDSPFKNSDNTVLKGLGVGVAYAQAKAGPPNGTIAPPATYAPIAGLRTLDTFTAVLVPDSNIKYFSPQAYWYSGPFGILAEYVSKSETLARTAATIATTSQDVKNNAWQVLGTWVITGENATYNSGVTPKKNFLDGGTGAVELVARYQVLNLDDKNFSAGFLSKTASVSQAKGIGASINWYLAPKVKFQVDFDDYKYTDGVATGNRKDDKTLFTRAQIGF